MAAMRALAITLALFTAPALAAAPAPDHAAVRRTLESAGLMGVWGIDCEAMASSTGWEQIVVDERGVVQSIEGGDDAVSTYDIVAAERINESEVRMRFAHVDPDVGEGEDAGEPAADAITVVYRIEGDRQMTWSSVTDDGTPLITDGVFAGGDQRSVWYQRCPKGIPVP